MKLWYKQLGFHSNPFSIKPAAFHDELIAYDLEYIYEKIDNGQMVFIEGPYGTGKTTILKNVINRYRGKNRIIYYNFNKVEDEFKLKKQLSNVNSMLKKMIGMGPKNVILLLDEVMVIKNNESKDIIDAFIDGVVKSVVFVNHDYYAVKMPEDIEEYLRGNVIRTAKLTTNEAVGIVRKRIGNLRFLPDDIIKKIYVRSNMNPRRLLEYCEDVCRYAMELGDMEVTEEHIQDVLPKTLKAAPKKKAEKPKKEEKQQAAEVVQEKEPEIKPLEQAKLTEIEPELEEEVTPETDVNPVAEAAINPEPTKAKAEGKSAESKSHAPDELPEYRVVFYESAEN